LGLVSFLAFLSLLTWDLCPFAIGETSFQITCELLSYSGLLLVFSVASVGSGCHELSKLMSYHILSDIYRHMFSAVVNCDCMTNHLREDCGTAGPGLDNLLLSGFIHRIYFL